MGRLAGWYDDDTFPGWQRFWDGQRWGERRPRDAVPTVLTAGPAPEGRMTAAAPAPRAAPGWYDDPELVNTRRYWDGDQWTTHRLEAGTGSAAAPPSVAASAATTDTLAYVWSVALLPLAFVVVDFLSPALDAQAIASPVTLVYWIASLALCSADSKRLRLRRGIQVPATWALLIPAYLIVRSSKSGSTPAIPIVWFATVLLSLIVSTALLV